MATVTMSVTDVEVDGAHQPRRGSRVRKQVERYAPGQGEEDVEEENKQVDDDDDEENENDSNKLTKKRKQSSRVKKAAAFANKSKSAGKGRTRKDRASSPLGQALDHSPKTDSPLFNALLSSDIAIQPLVEDWVETYQSAKNNEDAERAAVGELVLFLIRCCGVSSNVDEDEAMDRDGIRDVVERIQDESVKTNAAIYPLIAREKNMKPFKNNLDTFITHLISTLSLTPHLYDTETTTMHSLPLIPLLLTWLSSMSSSPLRPIRHTSTHIALKINSSLCDVATAVSKDLSVKQRQREAEAKKGTGKRLKDAEAKVKEVDERKTQLEEYMQEILNVLFVHRVRDADPAIRADCMRELGIWTKKFPEKYVNPSYLIYFGRGCNDPEHTVRLETVKSLVTLFSSQSATTSMAIRQMPRLVEMALKDSDTSVRVQALNVITAIDKTGLLQDEDETEGSVRDNLASLIFDADPRVRKAVGRFVHGLWQEKVESLKAGLSELRGQRKKRADAVKDIDLKLKCKALANVLVNTSKAISDPANRANGSTSTQKVGGSSSARLGFLIPATGITRAEAAVEALWNEIDLLQEWKGLVEYLLLDHSSGDLWLLDEDEENFMLQVLVACIKDTDEDDDAQSKSLMQILPRLFTKHQSDIGRIAGIFSLVEQINLSLYLDLRMTTQYEALWDDVTKQFLLHHDPVVLSSAIQAINHLVANSAMAAINTQKLIELDEALFTSLRDVVGGNDDVTHMAIDDDQRTTIEAILTRLSYMYRSRDLTEAMEDEEGGQSSGWTIITAFEGRARTGYKEEAKIVENAMQIIFLHVAWLLKRNSEITKTRRDEAKNMFEQHGVTNPVKVDSVRRQAYIAFLNLHVLFFKKRTEEDSQLSLEIFSETQHKLEGALNAFIERFASDHSNPEQSIDLEELKFIQLVSAFVGAIRCGVIDVDHAKEPLVHYGRFGAAYDAVVKKLVDVLRDEGIYNGDPTTVCQVAGDALKKSFQIFLEGEDDEPSATISLAKLINTSFIIQGNHFTVLQQIHPDDVRDMHIQAIKTIFGQVAMTIRQEKVTKAAKDKSRIANRRARILSFFRALIFAIGPLASMGQPALEVREVLDAEAERSEAPVGGNKSWDGFNAYRKKLQGIAEKDPLTAERAKLAEKQNRVLGGGGEEEGDGATVGDVEDTETEGDDEYGLLTGISQAGQAENEENEEEEEEEEEEHGDVGENEEDDVEPSIILNDHSGLNLDLDEDGNIIDLDNDDEGDVGEKRRERSVSIEPTVKRRKTVRKF